MDSLEISFEVILVVGKWSVLKGSLEKWSNMKSINLKQIKKIDAAFKTEVVFIIKKKLILWSNMCFSHLLWNAINSENWIEFCVKKYQPIL